MGVLGKTSVVASVISQDFGDAELWPGVDLKVVVEPEVLTWWVGLGLTHQRNILCFQSGVSPLRYSV